MVTGTKARGFRNRDLRKYALCQDVTMFSTALNVLTSLYNRVSSNAQKPKIMRGSAASWGLRPRQLATPLRGFAPGAIAPSHPASPNRRRAIARQITLRVSVPTIFELKTQLRHDNRSKGLSEESLAFSAADPRNRRWVAPNRRQKGCAQ